MEEKALRTVRVLYVAESNPLSGIKINKNKIPATDLSQDKRETLFA